MKTEGYVYILTNKGMRGLVKIGMTTQSVEERASSLSRTTGVPFPFEIAFQMKVTDCVACEKWLHGKFSHKRVNRGKEFFRVPPQEVIDALKEKVAPSSIRREIEEKKQKEKQRAESLAHQQSEDEEAKRLKDERQKERKEKVDQIKGFFGIVVALVLIIGVANFFVQFTKLVLKWLGGD